MLKIEYTRTTAPTKQRQLCLKCHSSYAYSDTPPYTPSGMSNSSTQTINTVRETEVGLDFSPLQIAYHPVMARGKNQPITPTGQTAGATSVYNANWPVYNAGTVSITTSGKATFSQALPYSSDPLGGVIPGWFMYVGATAPPASATSNWYQLSQVNTATLTEATVTPAPTTAINNASFALSAGLGNAFVPPYGPWATVVCSDCHEDSWGAGMAGPHGNEKKWQLKESTAGLTFKWWTGTLVTPNNSLINIQPNTGTVGGTQSKYTPDIFCYNCHRRDVYGDVDQGGALADNGNTANFTETKMSRMPHDPTAQKQTYAAGNVNKWGIVCMNCHGGDSLGGIHGTGATTPTVNENGGAGSLTGARPRGERFLNGATWVGSVKPTTTQQLACWTKSYSTDAVNVCTQGHANQTNKTYANYDY